MLMSGCFKRHPAYPGWTGPLLQHCVGGCVHHPGQLDNA